MKRIVKISDSIRMVCVLCPDFPLQFPSLPFPSLALPCLALPHFPKGTMVQRAISATSTALGEEPAIIQQGSVLVLRVALEPTAENCPPHTAMISSRSSLSPHLCFVNKNIDSVTAVSSHLPEREYKNKFITGNVVRPVHTVRPSVRPSFPKPATERSLRSLRPEGILRPDIRVAQIH
jgi:hypothetical protein